MVRRLRPTSSAGPSAVSVWPRPALELQSHASVCAACVIVRTAASQVRRRDVSAETRTPSSSSLTPGSPAAASVARSTCSTTS
jgi:hypothetical protein